MVGIASETRDPGSPVDTSRNVRKVKEDIVDEPTAHRQEEGRPGAALFVGRLLRRLLSRAVEVHPPDAL